MLRKYLLAFVVSVVSVFAVDVPLQKVMNVEISIGEYAVFDFPFKIKAANPTGFKSEYDVEQISQDAQKITGGTDYLDEKLPPKKKAPTTSAAAGKKGAKKKGTKALDVKRSSHTISIYPRKFGDMTFLVWGGKEPVMLKIKVTKDKRGPTHMKFLDYSKDEEEAKVLEKTSHEKVITVLTKHLYNKKTPKGYTAKARSKTFRIGKVKMKLVRSIVGDGYRADEWLVKNGYKQTKRFHEEMFYNPGIYSVSLEDDVLAPNEATRMFVVRNNSKR